MKINQLFLIMTLCTCLICLSPVKAGNVPILETIDLKVNGSINIQYLNQTPDTFSYIYRIIWVLHWENNVIDYDDFCNLDDGLINGTLILFNNIPLNSPIKDIHHFSHTSYDLTISTDDKNPKDNHLVSRLSFDKFIPGGLDVRDNQNLTFAIRDEINASVCDVFLVTIEGYHAPDAETGGSFPAIWSPVNLWNAYSPWLIYLGLPAVLFVTFGGVIYRMYKS